MSLVDNSTLTIVLEVLGLVLLLRLLYGLVSWLWLYCLRPATDWTKYGAHTGHAWALVTGSTEGVGLGFAEELASRGFNVLLLARRQARLQLVAEQLRAKFQVETRVLVADANQSEAEVFANIRQICEQVDVRVLVNNVGLNTRVPASLVDCTPEEVERMIHVNTRFPTRLTQELVPVMQTPAAIINVSSLSMFIPGPLLAVYAGTKAFNQVLSKALTYELGPSGFDVMAVTPGYVLSAGNPIKEESFQVISARKHAKLAMDKMGARTSLHAYYGHHLTSMLGSMTPEFIIGPQVRSMMEESRRSMLAEV